MRAYFKYMGVGFGTASLQILMLVQGIGCTLYWEKIVDSLSYQLSEKPAPRRDSAIAHDLQRNRIVIFGGRQTVNNHLQSVLMPVLFDDTWEFSFDTKQWRKLSFSLSRPSPRYGMLYSHNRHGLYVACGRGWLDEYFSDMWMYDFSKDEWKQMDQTHISMVPEARHGSFGGMYPAYESASSRLSGNGNGNSNFYLGHGSSQFLMHETMYAYIFTDALGLRGIWEKLYTDFLAGPYGFNYPHAREFASSAMVSEDELLVFGGCLSGGFTGGPCPSQDSWVYSYSKSKWTKVDSGCVSPRKHSAMAGLVSDGTSHGAIMFSGEEHDRTVLTSPHQEREAQVALFDATNRRWLVKTTQGYFKPEKRNGHVMCTGRFNGQYGVFVFGGYGHHSDTNMADLWFLQANVTQIFANQMISTLSNDNDNDDSCTHSTVVVYLSTIHVHALLMLVGWALFMNLKSFLQRYAQVNKKHVYRIASLGTLLEAAGILLITAGIGVGFYSSHGLPSLPHLIIGMTAYVCIVLQQIASHMRKVNKNDYILDEREDPSNKCNCFLFNMVHQNAGSIGLILGAINISMGLFYAVLAWYWLVLWFVFLGVCTVLYGFLEVVNFLNYSEDVNKDTKMKDLDSESLNYSNLSASRESLSHMAKQAESQFGQASPLPPPPPPVPSQPPQGSIPQRYVQQTRQPVFNSEAMNGNANGNGSGYSFGKVNNISQSNLHKLNKYQNSRENLVNTINLKYYL